MRRCLDNRCLINSKKLEETRAVKAKAQVLSTFW